MARELFAAGFVSCWAELDDGLKEQLVRSLEAALASPTIPPDIVTNLLNLAEFMEHDEKKLPLDSRSGSWCSLRHFPLRCQCTVTRPLFQLPISAGAAVLCY